MQVCEHNNPIHATCKLHRRSPRTRTRRGTTIVEFAIVLPVFLLFVCAIVEYGHTLMVANMVTSIAKQTAHQGSFEGTSSSDAQAFAMTKLNNVLTRGSPVVQIKNASSFELSSTDTSSVDISELPNIELSNAESRQLFLVYIEVPYEDVALFPPFWVRGLTLHGESVMRRE